MINQTQVIHFGNSNFKHQMKRLQIPRKRVHEVSIVKKFDLYEIAAVNLRKTYFLKNAKKTCKPNNPDLNLD